MPSITLSKMAEELNMTIEQVRILRKKMGNKGCISCHSRRYAHSSSVRKAISSSMEWQRGRVRGEAVAYSASAKGRMSAGRV